VLKLNKRTAKLEMKELNILKPDGSLQESIFADGIKVAANFANVPQEVKGAGLLEPESWREE